MSVKFKFMDIRKLGMGLKTQVANRLPTINLATNHCKYCKYSKINTDKEPLAAKCKQNKQGTNKTPYILFFKYMERKAVQCKQNKTTRVQKSHPNLRKMLYLKRVKNHG